MYLRLSRDDDSKTESESIKNQKIFLTEYIAKHSNWFLVDIYIQMMDIQVQILIDQIL